MLCPFCSIDTGSQPHGAHADCLNALKREAAALVEAVALGRTRQLQSVSLPGPQGRAADTAPPTAAQAPALGLRPTA